MEAMDTENYYIGSLPQQVEDLVLYEYFSQFGTVRKVDTIRESSRNLCRGYAFLTLELYGSEEEFLNLQHCYRGQPMYVSKKLQGGQLRQHKEASKNKRIYISIKNSRPIYDQEIINYFSQFGVIETAFLIKAKTGSQIIKKQFGYVHFQHDSSVYEVLRSRHYLGPVEICCEPYQIKDPEPYKPVPESARSNNQIQRDFASDSYSQQMPLPKPKVSTIRRWRPTEPLYPMYQEPQKNCLKGEINVKSQNVTLIRFKHFTMRCPQKNDHRREEQNIRFNISHVTKEANSSK